MLLTPAYLGVRHALWRQRIAEAGIWDAKLFQPVNFIVRRRSKSYEGMFRRKIVRGVFGKRVTDEIILYNPGPEASVREVDETLVHEMIHQYITQNELRDTRTHGHLFQHFMASINAAFKEELTITIKGTPRHQRGPGTTLHYLIILRMSNGESYVCVVNPQKVGAFLWQIEDRQYGWDLLEYWVAVSDDRYFDTFSRCTSRLHGLRIPEASLGEFCREYRVKRLEL